MKPLWILLCFGSLCLLSCITARSGNGHFVVIGLQPEGNCKTIGPVSVTAKSKPEVKVSLKEKTASMGGNFVHLQELKLDRSKGDYTANGVAHKCK